MRRSFRYIVTSTREPCRDQLDQPPDADRVAPHRRAATVRLRSAHVGGPRTRRRRGAVPHGRLHDRGRAAGRTAGERQLRGRARGRTGHGRKRHRAGERVTTCGLRRGRPGAGRHRLAGLLGACGRQTGEGRCCHRSRAPPRRTRHQRPHGVLRSHRHRTAATGRHGAGVGGGRFGRPSRRADGEGARRPSGGRRRLRRQGPDARRRTRLRRRAQSAQRHLPRRLQGRDAESHRRVLRQHRWGHSGERAVPHEHARPDRVLRSRQPVRHRHATGRAAWRTGTAREQPRPDGGLSGVRLRRPIRRRSGADRRVDQQRPHRPGGHRLRRVGGRAAGVHRPAGRCHRRHDRGARRMT